MASPKGSQIKKTQYFLWFIFYHFSLLLNMSGSANSDRETEDYSETEEEEDDFLAYIPEDQRV